MARMAPMIGSCASLERVVSPPCFTLFGLGTAPELQHRIKVKLKTPWIQAFDHRGPASFGQEHLVSKILIRGIDATQEMLGEAKAKYPTLATRLTCEDFRLGPADPKASIVESNRGSSPGHGPATVRHGAGHGRRSESQARLVPVCRRG